MHTTPQYLHPSQHFKGLGVALVTPFKQGQVDINSFTNLLRNVAQPGGADFLTLLGTTGESPSVDEGERNLLLSTIRNQLPGMPVLLGVGDNNTARLTQKLQDPVYQTVEALLCVVPYYNKPSQEGLYRHFCAVAEAAPAPVIIYNIPGRTGVDMQADTVVRLQEECPNIIGIKEATGSVDRAAELVRRCKPHFVILSGDDHITRPLCCAGGHGVISVVGNAYPTLMKAMVEASVSGNRAEAERIDNLLSPLYKSLFAQGNPAGIKSLLHSLSVIDSQEMRLPLWPVSEELNLRLKEEAQAISAAL